MASWSFVVTDNNYRPLGEVLNAKDRKIALPLSKLPTCSFTVRLDNPLGNQLMSTACYIKGYRYVSGVPSLQFFGPVVSAEENADRDTQSIAVNAIGVGWVLAHRVAGKSALGQQFSTVTDRAQIAKTLINAANTESETGISTTIASISAASGISYIAGPYKMLSECVSELATAFDGFDWLIDPLDNYAGGNVTSLKIGSFRAAPVISTAQSNTVFEYGDGHNNIASYRRSVTRDTQANKVYHIPTSGPADSSVSVKFASDAQSVLTWGLLEDIAQADITDATFRQQLVNQHVMVRKNPRQIIDFTPHIDPYDSGRVPLFGTDYNLGDRVRARIEYNGQTRLDAIVRCYGWAADIDDNSGVESQTLTLVDEDGQ